MDTRELARHIDHTWDTTIVPTLVEYIKIPNKSSHFDVQWAEHGHMARAVDLISAWCRRQPISGLTVEVHELAGRTPVIYMEIPGSIDRTVLLYGHLDKQPEMVGWREGLGPWTPVIEGDKLYGRGGADDGYAAFASLTAIAALQAQGVAHARCVVIIEASEESGSPDLPAHIEALAGRIGSPDLVVCLDSGCGNYDQLWATTSLRGMVGGELTVEILKEGVHSGDASGVVADSFRIARHLLDRVEDPATGRVLLPELHGPIPPARVEQARVSARVLGADTFAKFPWVEGSRPMGDDAAELVLARTWRPTLTVVGAGGLPPSELAGNVLRPKTTLKLSFRLPPRVDPELAYAAVKRALEADPPYGAKVHFEGDAQGGWDAPPVAPWLDTSVQEASQTFFGREAVYMGEGGSIPFMGMLGQKFPAAQFLITGVLGPKSNAHGPNEFLHIPTGKRLTACVAYVVGRHAAR